MTNINLSLPFLFSIQYNSIQMTKILSLIIVSILFVQCNQQSMLSSKENQKANRLINESSPYLLQHAYNPVDWYPWGDEALEKAKKEDKLLIISVGYAACHWCHVMEHESFEDSTVAKLMNDNFISIKVDREERPDVDDVYMTAAQLISGRGGWPLNAIALPDGKPVFAGTYYPKENWMEILNQILRVKNEEPEKLKSTADKLTEGISSSNLIEINTNDLDIDLDTIANYVARVGRLYDQEYGGRQGAPKFPMPNSYEFLMKYHWMSGDQQSFSIVETALEKMAKGGIYDQLGGGFARYSVDQFWLVPHFEKMLYDNAQLVSVYSHAYQLTKKPLYKKTVEQTLEYIKREMTSKENGFYSSLDADSEGEEGKFYVWSEATIDSIIGNEEHARIFKKYYDVSGKGNWEHTNILNVVSSVTELAREFKKDAAEIETILSDCSQKLMTERDTRVRPGLDDKILTSWNALMITGYLDAYRAFQNQAYLQSALDNAQFIVDNQMDKDGRLDRNFKDGKSSINAFLDDYALLSQAFLNLYEVTFDVKWIDLSEKLTDYAIAHFYNEESKMFDYTSDLDPPLIAKKAEYNDNVIPASNSAMARSLFKLGTLKYNVDHIDIAEQMLKNMVEQMLGSDYLSFYSNWGQLLLDFVKPPYEIAIVGEDALEKRKELAKHYLGNSIILGTEGEENLDLLKDKTQEGSTMIYVCQNKVCKMPVSDISESLMLIK